MTIAAPNFIIHAAGSLGNRPDLGKKAYRLHCRFRVPAYSGPVVLEKAKCLAAGQFIEAMEKKGYQYIGESGRIPANQRGFRMKFMGAHIAVMNLVRPPRRPTAREMLPNVMQGATYRAKDEPFVFNVPAYQESEFWDYDISTIFLRNTILVDLPDSHEERRH